ncbi:DNA alkylation repair protein [Patescibacteria group bacterium]|nr:DNA alkylation repair protein [Patescibacteria group bacterium]
MVKQKLIKEIISQLKKRSQPGKALVLQSFFKTGPGQYAAGDIFWGVTVPEIRYLVKQYYSLCSLVEVKILLSSPIHEQRLLALLILVKIFESADVKLRKKIYDFYFQNWRFVNNWDLVDLSADKILGAYLFTRSRRPLYKMAKSANLWRRRQAILATFYFIKQQEAQDTLVLAKILLNDQQDLIHKAVGWMLREVGKRCGQVVLEDFLEINYRLMPRTMLRYAIERLPEKKRRKYLYG